MRKMVQNAVQNVHISIPFPGMLGIDMETVGHNIVVFDGILTIATIEVATTAGWNAARACRKSHGGDGKNGKTLSWQCRELLGNINRGGCQTIAQAMNWVAAATILLSVRLVDSSKWFVAAAVLKKTSAQQRQQQQVLS
jgi:hypothetical protein